MPGSIYPNGKYTWVHDVLGNFVCVHDGELRATVISSAWEPWQVTLHYEDVTHLLMGEVFDNPQNAMRRAGEMLDLPMEDRNTAVYWWPMKQRRWQ